MVAGGLWRDSEFPDGQVPERSRTFTGVETEAVVAIKGEHPVRVHHAPIALSVEYQRYWA